MHVAFTYIACFIIVETHNKYNDKSNVIIETYHKYNDNSHIIKIENHIYNVANNGGLHMQFDVEA